LQIAVHDRFAQELPPAAIRKTVHARDTETLEGEEVANGFVRTHALHNARQPTHAFLIGCDVAVEAGASVAMELQVGEIHLIDEVDLRLACSARWGRCGGGSGTAQAERCRENETLTSCNP